MRNRVVKAAVFFLIMICCAGGGYLLGGYQGTDEKVRENNKQVSDVRTSESEQKAEGYDTELVAVVNLDVGSGSGPKVTSYSQALLGTLDVPYEITGLEAAKQGIQTGRYSSYLVIPGTFSDTVETINATPQKAVLEYALSGNLTTEAKEKAIYNIGEIYTKLNDGLSEIYIAFILSEVHNVQDSSGIVLNNDRADIEALDSVQGNDLIETIKIPELEMVENDIQLLDLAAAYAENDEILSSIDGVYESAVTDGRVDYDKIKEQVAAAEESKNSAGEALNVLNSSSQYDDSGLVEEEDNLYFRNTEELKRRIDSVENAVADAKSRQLELTSY